MQKYGFVYLWYDSKHKRYYIGSHWGKENDSYICSSNIMREAYRDWYGYFKRRTVARVYTNRLDLLTEEQRWLDMIKPEEFGQRYYNIRPNVLSGLWWTNEETKKQVGAKISKALTGKYKGRPAHNKGIPMSYNQWIKLKGRSMTPEQCKKMSDFRKGKPYEQIYGIAGAKTKKEMMSKLFTGRTIPEHQRKANSEYMKKNNPMKNPETVKKAVLSRLAPK